MKPLTIITTYGRFDVTKAMLMSLEPSAKDLDVVIVDNGSEREMGCWLSAWAKRNAARAILVGENIGCPRALNLGLECRLAGQPVIKLDNDIEIVSPGWVAGLKRLVRYWQAHDRHIAMLSAYYEPWQQQRVKGTETYEGKTVYHIWPVVGHAVWHTAEFMDQVGHFDVLSPEHLYGFEDLILSHKANILNWELLAWEGWTIKNLQRHSAIGSREVRDGHVEAMRPLYNERLRLLRFAPTVRTNREGFPELEERRV